MGRIETGNARRQKAWGQIGGRLRKKDNHDNDAGLRPNDTQNSTQNVVVVDKGGEASSAPSVAVPSTGWHVT